MGRRLSNLYGLFHLTDLHLSVQRFLIPPELDVDRFSYRRRCNHAGQILRVDNCLAVKFHDHVSLLDSCFLCRTSWNHLGNQGSVLFFEAEGFHQFRSYLLDAHAEPAAGYMSFLLELRSDLFSHVDRDRESDSLSRSDDRRVDTHDFAFCVDEWATAVARVDRSIGLNKIVIRSGSDHSSLGTDNPRGHCLFQSKWTTDGDDPTTDFQFVGIA